MANDPGHTCCARLRTPKDADEFAALPYPPSANGNSNLNRVKNPHLYDARTHTYSNPFHLDPIKQKGWAFPLKRSPPPPLLDGSDDGGSRGTIIGFAEKGKDVLSTTPPRQQIWPVCANAGAFKMLRTPSGGSEPCVMTFFVYYDAPKGTLPPGGYPNPPADRSRLASGWMPISGLDISPATRTKVQKTISSCQKCINQQQDWLPHLTKGVRKFHFASELEVLDTYAKIASGQVAVAHYFNEVTTHAVRKRIAHVHHLATTAVKPSTPAGLFDQTFQLSVFYQAFFQTSNPRAGHLGDYLARPPDYKNLGGTTNLSANLSVTPSNQKALKIPIAGDIFPAGHEFFQLPFRGQDSVLSPIWYLDPPSTLTFPPPPAPRTAAPKRIGWAQWVYGYAWNGPTPSAQRSYGWVPKLALK